jgi:hypothetical protein
MNTWIVYLVTGIVFIDAEKIDEVPDGIEFRNGQHKLASFASYLGWERHSGVMTESEKNRVRYDFK